MSSKRTYRQITRSLRFRLAAVYSLFFVCLLAGAAAVFQTRLASVLNDRAHNLVNHQQWAVMKGYESGSRPESGLQPEWRFRSRQSGKRRDHLPDRPGRARPFHCADSPLSHPRAAPTVTVGGVNAPVAFAGMTPSYVVLAQINVTVPSLSTGTYPYPVVIMQGGQTSNGPVMNVTQ